MTDNHHNPFKFWQELKQRKVVRVITVYTASALAILQAADMVLPKLGFPSWTITLTMILLGCGLVVSVALSWIYDITPEGIVKTEDSSRIVSNNDSGIEYVVHHLKPDDLKSSAKVVTYDYDLRSDKIWNSKKQGRIYIFSSAIVITCVILLFIFSSSSSVPFAKRDWVVITDFKNLTNDPVFDMSLYTAFTLTASQSQYINILPRSRMLETLQRMEISNQAYIDEEKGREIAIREGIDLYILPSISRVGNKYVLAAEIMESGSGNLLRSEIIYSETGDEILDRLDLLSKKMRRNLGESRYRIATQDKPLKKVTTSSLEALKLYSQGIDHHLMMDFKNAIHYYENALKVDTGFISAKASLGNLLIERDDAERGQALLNQAVRSVDKLTEKEKLAILTFHAVNVEKNILKGIEYSKMRIELYPDDATSRNNLGYYYFISGMYEEALTEYKATVRIFPDMALPYGGISWIYLEKLGKIDSAFIWACKMISDNHNNAWGYFYLGSAFFSMDSIHKAEEAFLKGHEKNPDLLINEFRLAHTYRMQGRYDEAIEILTKILPNDNEAPSAYYDLGINYELKGDPIKASQYYNSFKKIATEEWMKTSPDDPQTYLSVAAISARLSDNRTSGQMLSKAIEKDPALHHDFAEILCLQGKTDEALKEIESALKNGYRDIVWLKMNPDYSCLQNESRFKELLVRYFMN